MWGESTILNSKAEFNRCTIGRLTLGENKEEESKLRELLMVERNKLVTENNRETESWEKERMQNRRVQEVQRVVNLGRGVVRSPGHKRTGEDENNSASNSGKKIRVKRKYPLLGRR